MRSIRRIASAHLAHHCSHLLCKGSSIPPRSCMTCNLALTSPWAMCAACWCCSCPLSPGCAPPRGGGRALHDQSSREIINTPCFWPLRGNAIAQMLCDCRLASFNGDALTWILNEKDKSTAFVAAGCRCGRAWGSAWLLRLLPSVLTIVLIQA